jgi:arsenite-transporting ATPase
MEIDAATESQRYVAEVKAHIAQLFGHSILKEANRQIDLAATMPGAEEVALFDRMGSLIRGEDERFDLIVFDTAPTGHTLRLIRMPELMEAWIRALSRSRRAMLGVDQDDKDDPIMITLSARLERLRLLRARLVSGRTTGFVLVLIPERLPIEETSRAIAQLDEAGVKVGGLILNRVLPESTSDAFLAARRRQERVYLEEIDRRFAAHPIVRIPQMESDVYGLASLERISKLLVS